jgi:membrane fusion protein (multidrug efflux system)
LAVAVSPVEQQDVPVYAHWVGSVQGFNNAQIRPQIRGYLLRRQYAQGTVVEPESLLFEIDPREFRAALDAATGQLRESEALREKTRMHVARYGPLAQQGAISQQEFDDAVQNLARNQAAVTSAKANVERAQLSLDWTKIQSPIFGVAGIANAQIGDLVGPETVLTTVSQLDPVKVQFPVSEQEYLAFVKQLGKPAEGNFEGASDILELRLADGSAWPHRGTPFVLGRAVDPLTGTIQIEARFSNPDHTLRPGFFARIRALVGTQKGAFLVPQRAIRDVQGNYQVAIVNPEDRIEIRNVEVGDTVGAKWIVNTGLKAGERVVVEGIQKVRDGMPVTIRPASDAKAQTKDTAPRSTS